jgi:hypothetical protein
MVWRAVLLTLALSLAGALGSGASAEVSSSDLAAHSVVASGTDALRLAVEVEGRRYGGDCSDARSPENIGMVCSKFVATSGQLSAYMTGRAFSEFTSWVFVADTARGWCPVATVPLDPTVMTASVPWPSSAAMGTSCAPTNGD